MSRYGEIYSEYGLKKMIENNFNKIEEKTNDIIEVKAGRKWNPLCRDENIRILEEDIKRLEDDIGELKEALKNKVII